MKQLLKLNESNNNINNNVELIKKHVDANFESLFNKINTIERTFNNKLDELYVKINSDNDPSNNVYIEVNDTKENSENDIESYINEFEDIFMKSPIKDQGSGFGFNEGVFFYTILKISRVWPNHKTLSNEATA